MYSLTLSLVFFTQFFTKLLSPLSSFHSSRNISSSFKLLDHNGLDQFLAY